jgi:hypothetical protein
MNEIILIILVHGNFLHLPWIVLKFCFIFKVLLGRVVLFELLGSGITLDADFYL